MVERGEVEPRVDIAIEDVALLAQEGLVEDVMWALGQIPGMTIAEAIPLQDVALRNRSEQLRSQAEKYVRMSTSFENQGLHDRMMNKANDLWTQANAHLTEARRLKEINRLGFESESPQEPS
jgi:hypothetical protein